MGPFTLLLLLAQAAPPQPDTTLFIPRESLMRLYTDCDEDRWPWGTEEAFVAKSAGEIVAGIERRRGLEARWRTYYAERAGDSMPPTPMTAWAYPLAERGRLLNNYNNPRQGGFHGALDMFVQREGVVIRAPVSGLVLSAGDGWRGGWNRRAGFTYEGDGLSRRAGNGLILFDPATGGYLLFSHLQNGVLVRAGDVVRRGQALGTVGHTGNAAYPSRGRHLHFAFKRPGTACGVAGVLVAENPYRTIRAARLRRGG